MVKSENPKMAASNM